jgi:hypothetical protein
LYLDIIPTAKDIEIGPNVGGIVLVDKTELCSSRSEVDNLIVCHNPVRRERSLFGEVDVVVIRRPSFLRRTVVSGLRIAIWS